MNITPKRVVVAAGGTGGHINPALALCQELKRRDAATELLFIGTADHMEATLVPKAGFDFASIDISGFQRSLSPDDIFRNLVTVKKLLFVTGQCKKILKDFMPDIVVGFGGYVSGPVVRTAHKMGIKTAIHEQNAFPGKTNIALSKYVDAVMLTSQQAEKRLKCRVKPTVTGLPVREEMLSIDMLSARHELGIPDDKRVVLSTGGSLGAEAINKLMCDVIPKLAGGDIIFVHGYGQYGTWVPERLAENGLDIKNDPTLRISEYIYDMAKYMAAADLVIGRAGASSLAEIQVLGKPSLLIPSPNVAENHQYHNAMSMVNRNAAMIMEEKELDPLAVIELLRELVRDPERFKETGRHALEMAFFDAKKNICDIVLSLT